MKTTAFVSVNSVMNYRYLHLILFYFILFFVVHLAFHLYVIIVKTEKIKIFFIFLPCVYGSCIYGNYMLLFFRRAAHHINFSATTAQQLTGFLMQFSYLVLFGFHSSRCFCSMRLLKEKLLELCLHQHLLMTELDHSPIHAFLV